MSLIANTITNLEWVAAYWPDLTESRLPGTARPWRQPHLTAEQRDERDRTAMIERYERSESAPGEAPAPVDVAVLDTMHLILTEAVELADAVAEHAAPWRPPEPPSTAFADPRPYMSFITVHLAQADLADPAVGRETAWTVGAWVGQVARALVLVHDGQWLSIECPWCRGVTPESPAGGAFTWRVRELPGEQIAILCENPGGCEPPSKDVGTWWRGRPCWPLREWDWLAQRLQAAEEPPARYAPGYRIAPEPIDRGAAVRARADLLDGLVFDTEGEPVRGAVR